MAAVVAAAAAVIRATLSFSVVRLALIFVYGEGNLTLFKCLQ